MAFNSKDDFIDRVRVDCAPNAIEGKEEDKSDQTS